MVKRICLFIFGFVNIFNIKSVRKFYWNVRAKDIYERWGDARHDYPVIGDIIKQIAPKKILDIGCGSGRLFNLYYSFNPDEVVGQDISMEAIKLANQQIEKFKLKNILLTSTPLSLLQFPENYFDLSVSSRILSAVHPSEIDETIHELCKISNYVYVNEMTDSDYCGLSSYWFKHDYFKFFRENNMELVRNETIPNTRQSYYLFKKVYLRPLGH